MQVPMVFKQAPSLSFLSALPPMHRWPGALRSTILFSAVAGCVAVYLALGFGLVSLLFLAFGLI